MQIKIYVGRRLVVDYNHPMDWIDGELLYDLAPDLGVLYPVITNRVRRDDPVQMTDKFSTKVDREFYFEANE